MLISQNIRKGISEKELSFISKFELKGKYFFTRDDIRDKFTTDNEMNVYLHRMKKKGRIIKLNKDKYYLIPVKAVNSKWSEHPFIIIDEIMNGKDYCIIGKAAAHYWKLIDQIPYEYEVYNTKKHELVNIFNSRIDFRKRRKKNIPTPEEKKIYDHKFLIASKTEAKKWA
jgi:predicted transcriptional regulator of viral defense system